MAKRRLLPEAAYDFWARDGRDGEEGRRRDSLAFARRDARRWKATILDSWRRCVITVEWAVNERKVLRLLAARKESDAK